MKTIASAMLTIMTSLLVKPAGYAAFQSDLDLDC